MENNNISPQQIPENVEGHCLDCAHGLDGQCGSCGNCPRANISEPPRGKLYATNWLEGISDASDFDLVEVQFKNTRKGFYRNVSGLDIHMGDLVAVEASPGHDIGEVTMVGRLVQLHIKKANLKPDHEFKKIFRIARPSDIERFKDAKAKEQDAMIRSRKIAEDLQLNMKIGDVEYQGDGAKAIFYYLADERVDFRKLIRVLADTFKVRIEMKQIGARQEAGRIGGIGPCGRPLCCSSWMTGFVSVGTSAARFQDLSMNPQKLAGQCAKLKCCLNFEVDAYMEASRKLPDKSIPLETQDSTYYHFKSDIMSGMMTYSTDKHAPVNCVTIPAERVKEIIEINKQGKKVDSLEDAAPARRKTEFVELVGQDNINRFDKSKKKKKRSGAAAYQDKKKNNPVSQEKKSSQSMQQSAPDKKPERKEKPGRNKNKQQKSKPKSDNDHIGTA
ncbi:MAG: hypothetical protein NC402_06485 [Prevotella sp.]|nr:hypothetical protein [Prevotella sp.]MCM1075348.1 hypothetical protein [Ruminococcus sp.]